MSVIWLIVWLIKGTPAVVFNDGLNNWAVSLVVCIVVDILITIKDSKEGKR